MCIQMTGSLSMTESAKTGCLRRLAGVAMAAFVAVSACGAVAPTDAERQESVKMNAETPSAARPCAGGVKVVFLGNSITLHGRAPALGWTNLCGMAASEPDKDYVHLVVRGIEKRTGRKADVRVRNLAGFERGFKSYELAHEADLVAFAPDYLVIAIGENVGNLNEDERKAFEASLGSLLDRFMKAERPPRTVVRGVFWRNAWKDGILSRVARARNAVFVETADLGDDPAMRASGFSHAGVAAHPGDAGMAAIAERILLAF